MSTTLQKTILAICLSAGFGVASYGAPEVYLVNSDRTRPLLYLGYFGYWAPVGRFNRSSGRVVFDSAGRSASVEVILDTESIDTGYPGVDQLLRGGEFLNTATYPKAVFRSSRVHFVGDRPVKIDGTLTVKGVTQPITLVVNSFRRLPPPIRHKETLAVGAASTVRRADFGMGGVMPNFGNEIRVEIDIEVVRE